MNKLTQFKIVDWTNSDICTNGETFDSFEQAWGWIYEYIPDADNAYDDLFVVPIEVES